MIRFDIENRLSSKPARFLPSTFETETLLSDDSIFISCVSILASKTLCTENVTNFDIYDSSLYSMSLQKNGFIFTIQGVSRNFILAAFQL